MADTRMLIKTAETQRDGEDSVPATIKMTVGMRRRIGLLVEMGICGATVEEVCERLVCRELQRLERDEI